MKAGFGVEGEGWGDATRAAGATAPGAGAVLGLIAEGTNAPRRCGRAGVGAVAVAGGAAVVMCAAAGGATGAPGTAFAAWPVSAAGAVVRGAAGDTPGAGAAGLTAPAVEGVGVVTGFTGFAGTAVAGTAPELIPGTGPGGAEGLTLAVVAGVKAFGAMGGCQAGGTDVARAAVFVAGAPVREFGTADVPLLVVAPVGAGAAGFALAGFAGVTPAAGAGGSSDPVAVAAGAGTLVAAWAESRAAGATRAGFAAPVRPEAGGSAAWDAVIQSSAAAAVGPQIVQARRGLRRGARFA